jgi:protein tyrosine phosphatase (PTP) superfamily phosphohydrolase (DUF442 family)
MPATFRANSGMDFPKSVNTVDPSKFKSRKLILPSGAEGDLMAAGSEENTGLMSCVPSMSGVFIAAVQTEPKLISLDSSEFNAYLVSDGLPHIYRLRSEEGILDQPGRERYSKSPKAILQVGKGGGGDPTRIVGLPLEIVPLQNPFQLKVGDTLRVRVLFQGQTLADANLGWDHPDDGEPPSGTVRADSNGEALIPISRIGLITIRLTHMTRPKAIDYEWESFWTTLTFRVPEAENVAIRSQQDTTNFEIQKLAVNHLPNAIQIHSKVISGGLPEGVLAFKELKQLGVKTIISVDGAQPDLALAKQYGLRYVHLPHGYDGIAENRVKELAKAVLALDGPIYIHCHHGKHRSPAAATAASITAGLIDPSASKAILKLAGTSGNYIGLFASVAKASKTDQDELDAIRADFPESAKLPPMAEAMVAIEHTHDHLKQFSATGWKALPKHPDLEAAHEALLLTEHFTELLRLPIVAEHPDGFKTMLRESEIKSKELDASIRAWNEMGNPTPVPRSIVEPFERVSANCISCHRAFRDLATGKPK